GIKHGVGCTGSVGLGSKGSVKLILVGQTVYMNPDKQFWTANAGANADAAIALVNGRDISVPSSHKKLSAPAYLCSLKKLVDRGSGDFTKGAVTTLDGRRVLPIKDPKGGVAYVTDTSKPEYVKITAPQGDSDGSGEIVISVGAPVTVAAPPASEVVDGT